MDLSWVGPADMDMSREKQGSEIGTWDEEKYNVSNQSCTSMPIASRVGQSRLHKEWTAKGTRKRERNPVVLSDTGKVLMVPLGKVQTVPTVGNKEHLAGTWLPEGDGRHCELACELLLRLRLR